MGQTKSDIRKSFTKSKKINRDFLTKILGFQRIDLGSFVKKEIKIQLSQMSLTLNH